MNKHYNLADIIRFKLKHGLEFDKSSIAYRYLTALGGPYYETHTDCPASTVNFDLLDSLIDKRVVDDTTFLAIHLRVGDCLYGSHKKIFSPDDYIKIIKNHRIAKNFKKCKIFAGIHNSNGMPDKFIDLSQKYINTLAQKLDNKGFTVALSDVTEEHSWQKVDRDFQEIASAKCLIAGHRGFGWLSACMNPNKVIWKVCGTDKNFWVPSFKWREPKSPSKGHWIALVEGFLYQQKKYYKNTSLRKLFKDI